MLFLEVAHLAFAIALHTAPGHLQKHVDNVVSHTSDMGVELGVPDFAITEGINELLPPWLDVEPLLPDTLDDGDSDCESDRAHGIIDPLANDQEAQELLGELLSDEVSEGAASESDLLPPQLSPEVACADQQEAPCNADVCPPPERPAKFMPNALSIAGFQHLTNNICNDVHANLENWDTFYKQLKNIEALVRNFDRRRQYVWTCLRGSDFAYVEQLFEKFPMSVSLYEPRWSAVLEFLRVLQDFLPFLTVTWNDAKYESHMKERPASTSQQFSPAELTSTLTSPLFHLYVKMALSLEKIGPKLASFAESCPCHEHITRHKTRAQRITFFEEVFGSGVRSCPCSAMMMPELVAGVVDDMIRQACGDLRQELLCCAFPAGVLPPTSSDIQLVLADLQRGQVTLCTLLGLKTNYLKKLPWVMMGLAISDEQKARFIAQEAISQYYRALNATEHHPLSRKFLAHGCWFRLELEKFIQGTPRSDLSTIARIEMAKFRFCYSAESTIEGKHAQVSLASSTTTIGPVRVSLANRIHMVQHWLQCGQCTVEQLIHNFDKVRHLSSIAALLGIEQHPTIVNHLQAKKSGSLSQSAWRVMLPHIIYNVDFQSSFRDLSAAERVHMRHLRQRKGDGDLKKKGITFFDVEMSAMRQHMSTHMALGDYYACPHSLLSLASMESGRVCPPTPPLDPEEAEPQELLRREPLCFFSLAVTQIGYKKTMFVSAGLSGHIAADDLAITQHNLMEQVEAESYIVAATPNVLPTSRTPTWLCKPWTEDSHTRMKTELMSFKSQGAGWWIDGLEDANITPSSLHVVLTAMLQCGAIPSTTFPESYRATGTAEEVVVLNLLQVRGLAETEEGRWRLTSKAMQCLACTVQLRDPQPMFACRPDVALSDMNCWELMLQLSEQEWLWNRYISRGKRRTPLHYKAGDAKIWYSTKIPSIRYMQCLLQAEFLFEKGCPHVPHRAKDEVYKRILEGDFSTFSVAHVTADVEEVAQNLENFKASLGTDIGEKHPVQQWGGNLG